MLQVESLKMDKFKILFENIIKFIEERGPLFKRPKEPDVWEALLIEGRHDLIEKFRRIERGEGGFGTIVVPSQGFSKNKKTHELVTEWLSKKNVNILDVEKEKTELESALRDPQKNCKL